MTFETPRSKETPPQQLAACQLEEKKKYPDHNAMQEHPKLSYMIKQKVSGGVTGVRVEASLIGQIDFDVRYGDKTTGKACRPVDMHVDLGL